MTDLARSGRNESARGCNVALGGWYGAANLGDELILSTFVDWVRAAGGVPGVISVHPAYTRATLDVETASFTDLAEVVERIAACDVFVLGGGGLFQSYDAFDRASLSRFPARNVSQFAQYFLLARELGVATAVLGQGVGPLHTPDARDITAQVFSQADHCSVRDVESAQLLHAVGVKRIVPIAPDPAWAFHREPHPIELAQRFPQLAGLRVLAIAVRDWPFDADWEGAFATALKASVPEGWGCLWLDFSRTPSQDALLVEGSEIAHRLIPRLGSERVHVVWDGMRVEEAFDLIAACDALVAMRLHAALLGHLAGVPVVALEYDDKVRVLGDDLRVPADQRMSLTGIPSKLGAALRAVCNPQSRPFRLGSEARTGLARSALAHRDLLWRSMEQSMRTTSPVPAHTPLLASWLEAAPHATGAVREALARRIRARATPAGR